MIDQLLQQLTPYIIGFIITVFVGFTGLIGAILYAVTTSIKSDSDKKARKDKEDNFFFSQYVKLTDEIGKVREEHAGSAAKIEVLSGQLKDRDEKSSERDKEIHRIQFQADEDRKKADDESKKANKRIEDLSEDLKRQTAIFTQTAQERDEAVKNSLQLEGEANRARSALGTANEEIARLEGELSNRPTKEAFDQLKGAFDELKVKFDMLTKTVESLEAEKKERHARDNETAGRNLATYANFMKRVRQLEEELTKHGIEIPADPNAVAADPIVTPSSAAPETATASLDTAQTTVTETSATEAGA